MYTHTAALQKYLPCYAHMAQTCADSWNTRRQLAVHKDVNHKMSVSGCYRCNKNRHDFYKLMRCWFCKIHKNQQRKKSKCWVQQLQPYLHHHDLVWCVFTEAWRTAGSQHWDLLHGQICNASAAACSSGAAEAVTTPPETAYKPSSLRVLTPHLPPSSSFLQPTSTQASTVRAPALNSVPPVLPLPPTPLPPPASPTAAVQTYCNPGSARTKTVL